MGRIVNTFKDSWGVIKFDKILLKIHGLSPKKKNFNINS